MNSKFEGPLVGAFEADTKGVVKQVFITYRKRDGHLQSFDERSYHNGARSC